MQNKRPKTENFCHLAGSGGYCGWRAPNGVVCETSPCCPANECEILLVINISLNVRNIQLVFSRDIWKKTLRYLHQQNFRTSSLDCQNQFYLMGKTKNNVIVQTNKKYGLKISCPLFAKSFSGDLKFCKC